MKKTRKCKQINIIIEDSRELIKFYQCAPKAVVCVVYTHIEPGPSASLSPLVAGKRSARFLVLARVIFMSPADGGGRQRKSFN